MSWLLVVLSLVMKGLFFQGRNKDILKNTIIRK